ncbi:MAG: ATP-binding protein [Candidatus Glassbacteria bacterium]
MPVKRRRRSHKSTVHAVSSPSGESLAVYGSFSCNRGDRIVALDRAGVKILGLPECAEYRGLHFKDVFGVRPSERERILRSMKDDSGRFLGEVAISRPDGSTGVLLLNEVFKKSEDQMEGGSEGTFIDVTSERKWEKELFNIARNLGGTLDEGQIIDRIALDLSRVTGFGICSVVLFDEDGIKIHTRSPVKLGKGVQEDLSKQISNGIGIYLEYTMESSDMKFEIKMLPDMQSLGVKGKKKIRTHHIIPLLVGSQMAGIVHLGSFTPILLTERDKASLLTCSSPMAFALHNARSFEKQKKLNQMKSEFISNVSHALRTPMATMKQCISLLSRERGGPLTNIQRNFLGMIEENVDRLTGVLNNLLDLSKIEHGSMELNRTETDMVLLVKSIIRSFDPLIRSKGITFSFSTKQSSISAFVDGEIMRQIIEGLLSNAIKFTPRKKRIVLKLSTSAKRVMVCVKDEGCGMSRENLTMVFDKYRSFQKGIKAGVRGTGLGLALTKELVELHGGKIWIESAPRKGTEVSFVIPRMPFASIVQEKVNRSMQLCRIKGEGLILFLYIANLDGPPPSSSRIRKLKERLSDYLGPVLGTIEGQMIIDEEEERVAVLAPIKKRNKESIERAVRSSFKELLQEAKSDGNSLFSWACYPDEGETFSELLEALLVSAGIAGKEIHLKKRGGDKNGR